jgi:large subunit ribosomal protein L13
MAPLDLLENQKTPFRKDQDLTPRWVLIDAENQILGRVASRIAFRLRGKHRVDFAPHQAVGDHVVVVNAGKVRVTGQKLDDKRYYRPSGRPGGMKVFTLGGKLATDPTWPLKMAVKRMLPKGGLGRKLLRNVRFYADEKNDQHAQKPQALELRFK